MQRGIHPSAGVWGIPSTSEKVEQGGNVADVNNALSPHGGKLVDRVMEPEKGRKKAREAKTKMPIDGSRATEIMSIAYGFFSPLEGFMGSKDVDSVCKDMRLQSGYVWSIPIVFDISEEEI